MMLAFCNECIFASKVSIISINIISITIKQVSVVFYPNHSKVGVRKLPEVLPKRLLPHILFSLRRRES